jgi:hypothetical protein
MFRACILIDEAPRKHEEKEAEGWSQRGRFVNRHPAPAFCTMAVPN